MILEIKVSSAVLLVSICAIPLAISIINISKRLGSKSRLFNALTTFSPILSSWWFLVVLCGSLWFLVGLGHSWWFLVVIFGSRWFLVVLGGSLLFLVVLDGSW